MGAGSSTVEREDPWKTIVWETEYDDEGRRKDDEPREEGVFISVSPRLADRLFLEKTAEEEGDLEDVEVDDDLLLVPSNDLESFLEEIEEDEPSESISRKHALRAPDSNKEFDELEKYQQSLEMVEEEEMERIVSEIDNLSRRNEGQSNGRRGTECTVEREAAAECYAKGKDHLDCAKAVEAYSKCAQTTKEGNLARYKKLLGRE